MPERIKSFVVIKDHKKLENNFVFYGTHSFFVRKGVDIHREPFYMIWDDGFVGVYKNQRKVLNNICYLNKMHNLQNEQEKYYIESLSISEDERSKNIGSQLLTFINDCCYFCQVREILLVFTNLNNLKFYLRNGFKPYCDKRTIYDFEEDVDCSILYKKIQQPKLGFSKTKNSLNISTNKEISL